MADGQPDLPHLRMASRPELHRPALVAAFAGWNDAADASTWALRHLAERWGAEPFAHLDSEEFFDFSSTRPMVRISDDGERTIVWPGNELAFARPGRDVVLLQGIEPQLRWRTFCEHIVGVARQLDVQLVVTLGALLSEVPHSRPVVVYGTTEDPASGAALNLERSDYEGPTGIVGALHASCRQAGLASASLWAAVPTYVSGAASPKAALALVERVGLLLALGVPVTDLQIATATYERQINELVSADEDLVEYLRQLEARYEDRDILASDADEGDDDEDDEAGGNRVPLEPDADRLVAEVERFLREQD